MYMLWEVATTECIGMNVRQIHDHMEKCLDNLLTLLERLSEMIAYTLANSDLG